MEKFVTVLFDSEDSADFARARLNRSGVRYSRCDTFEVGMEHRDDLEVVINPYNSIYSNNIGENWGSLAGANMMNYGGFLFVHKHGENSAASASVMPSSYDMKVPHRSGEVLVRFSVDERDLELCKAVLTSGHGFRVRVE